MSNTLREATEHRLHTLTDLVGDAMQHIDLPHIDLPHIDLPRTSRRRRTISPTFVVAAIAAVVLVVFAVSRVVQGRKPTPDTGDAIDARSEADMVAAAAA